MSNLQTKEKITIEVSKNKCFCQNGYRPIELHRRGGYESAFVKHDICDGQGYTLTYRVTRSSGGYRLGLVFSSDIDRLKEKYDIEWIDRTQSISIH